MRKLVSSAFVSLDGVMQAPGGPKEDTSGGFKLGGWVFPYFEEKGGRILDELFDTPFDLLLGRKTYDIFAAYWPKYDAPDNARIARLFNSAKKYVATHRPNSLKWENSVWLGKDPVKSLRKLKKEQGPVLLTQGSSDFLQTLLKNDLIDELVVWTFPVTLGKGKRLFDKGALPGAWKLTKSVSTPTGVLFATYVRDGKVKTGSF